MVVIFLYVNTDSKVLKVSQRSPNFTTQPEKFCADFSNLHATKAIITRKVRVLRLKQSRKIHAEVSCVVRLLFLWLETFYILHF
jgi:hypothetical protein